jgi:hypothetical protein
VGVRSVTSDTVTQDLLLCMTSLATAEKGAPERVLAQLIRRIRDHFWNRVVNEGLVVAPTTASTQGSGTAGATVWNVNVGRLIATVNGTAVDLAAAADFNIHTGTVALLNGQSRRAAIVLINTTGTITCVAVKGAAATTGAQVAPTDAEITASVGATIPWIKIAECLLNRTGDTTVTQSEYNAFRPNLGVSVDSDFFSFVD